MSSFFESWNEAALSTLGLFWTAIWAFCLGYIVSSMIEVYVTRETMQQLMGKDGLKAMMLGTLFGFISSSCSFAALSGARALFAKGAGLAPALAFLLSSTNLVIELGIVIAVFLSWQFVVAEYVGGIMLIAFMWLWVRVTAHCIPLEEARKNAQESEGVGCCHHHGDGGERDAEEGTENDLDEEKGGKGEKHEHNEEEEGAGDDSNKENGEKSHEHNKRHPDVNETRPSVCEKLGDIDNLAQVAMQYFMEWSMVWKDVTIGFTVAGIIAAFVPREFFEWLFVGGSNPNFGQLLEQCIVGPVAAVFTFIGSMGNIPLAAVLYSNGVSFAGIIAFIFSDLIVIPVLRVNAKYYGWKMALYIWIMFFTISIVTALILHYVFDAVGALPSDDSVTEVVDRDFFHLDYTFGLNMFFLAISAVLFGWHFKMNGFSFSIGSTTAEMTLFWLAMTSYCWIIGGLFAGLAK